MGLNVGRESDRSDELRKDLQSHGLVTGKRGQQSCIAGLCMHREAGGEAQRRWAGTEQGEKNDPTIEVTQVQRQCGK